MNPQRTKGDALTSVVAFRLTAKDHAAYAAKVVASGLSPSKFFRECVLTNKTQIVEKTRKSADHTRLLFLFAKASNNMNQLAHRANSDHKSGVISATTYQEILQELESMNDYLKAALKNVD